MSRYISDAHPYTRGTHATQNHRIPGFTVSPHQDSLFHVSTPPPHRRVTAPAAAPESDNQTKTPTSMGQHQPSCRGGTQARTGRSGSGTLWLWWLAETDRRRSTIL